MATGIVTTEPVSEVVVMTWAALANGETGDAGEAPQNPDKSVQVSGTFTSLDIQGSNDGTNWAILHDSTGSVLTFTAAGIKPILENTLYVRPANIVAGGAVKVVIVGKGT
jgi:hypothetical protein